jgi:hypothetical protein
MPVEFGLDLSPWGRYNKMAYDRFCLTDAPLLSMDPSVRARRGLLMN